MEITKAVDPATVQNAISVLSSLLPDKDRERVQTGDRSSGVPVAGGVQSSGGAPGGAGGGVQSVTGSAGGGVRGRSHGVREAMMSNCDTVLDSLRRSRAGIIADKRTAIRKEMSTKLGKRPASKKGGKLLTKKPKPAWKHRFVCLAYFGQEKIPTTAGEKDELFEAGLGKKEVEFERLDISGTEFRDILEREFPKLKGVGGYRLFKCKPNNRTLELLSKAAQSPGILKQRVGNARTYIVSVQKDLDLTPCEPVPEQVEELCFSCGALYCIDELADHAPECERARVELEENAARKAALQRKREEQEFRDFEKDLYASDEERGSQSPSHGTQTVGDKDILPTPGVGDQPTPEFVEQEGGIENRITIDDYIIDSAPMLLLKISEYRDDKLCIDVRRECLLKDAVREGKKKFHTNKCLKVTFVGEGAIDMGGPRREFFRLFALNASQSTYFCGLDEDKFFSCDVPAVQRKEYSILGKYAAMSAIQGVPGFPFL